jgi:hypothetical protein
MATMIRSKSESVRLTSQHLTKSRYIAGLQCLRRLWMMVNQPQPYEEAPPGSPVDIGREIGRKAHLLCGRADPARSDSNNRHSREISVYRSRLKR